MLDIASLAPSLPRCVLRHNGYFFYRNHRMALGAAATLGERERESRLGRGARAGQLVTSVIVAEDKLPPLTGAIISRHLPLPYRLAATFSIFCIFFTPSFSRRPCISDHFEVPLSFEL